MTGPERTPTDNATTPSARVGTRAAVGRSVLGPHGIGNRWSSAGANGHRRYARIPRSQPIHIYGMGRWTGETPGSNPTSRSGVVAELAVIPVGLLGRWSGEGFGLQAVELGSVDGARIQ